MVFLLRFTTSNPSIITMPTAGLSPAAPVSVPLSPRFVKARCDAVPVGQPHHDLFFDLEVFGVPVGLDFVDVKAIVAVETQLQRASHAIVDAKIAEARIHLAALLAREAAAFELLRQVIQIAERELYPEVIGRLCGSSRPLP